MGAGGSAQAEYERRRRRDRERRGRGRKRLLVLVLLVPVMTYWAVQLAVWGINDWLYPSLVEAIGDAGEPSADVTADTVVTDALAHQLGLWLAGAATLASIASLLKPSASTEAWRKGAAGERATEADLTALPRDYMVAHDLQMPSSRANIDHLVIGPTGIFTIETKNYSNGVVLKSGKATSGGRSLERAVQQALAQAAAIGEVLGVAARPLICVQGGRLVVRGLFQKPTIDGVRFCSGSDLAGLITKGPRVLGPTVVAQLAQRRDGKRPNPTSSGSPEPALPAQALDAPRCDCGALQVARRRRSDGRPFWGCSTFPTCRKTKSA